MLKTSIPIKDNLFRNPKYKHKFDDLSIDFYSNVIEQLFYTAVLLVLVACFFIDFFC